VRHRGTLAGSLLLSAGLLAAAISAPALATTHKTTHHKGTKISTRVTTKYGRVVANSKGRVMYIFAPDGTKKTSHCTGACAAAWPKVTSKFKPVAGTDISTKHLSRNAKHQVTYYGHPLYYFSASTKPGNTSGENVNHFFVLSDKGKVIKPKKKSTGPTGPTGPAGPTVAATVSTGDVGASIEVITNGADGHTLYALTAPNETMNFWCVGGCLQTWIPLLTKGAPMVTGDAESGLVTDKPGASGFDQVFYNGFPVYEYIGDSAAGQDTGEGLVGPYTPPAPNQQWFDLTPAGAFNQTA
jgi:predicted lipoprotein with Yx(FWY)xxD motif